jgi:hypothetical protein
MTMRFDFSSVDDIDSYVFVPEGEHNCRVADVREGTSRDGSARWSFRLEVLDGEWAGRTAAWDSLTWSERGVYRVKKVLEALGLDVRGELEIEPQDLLNLQALVRVVPEEREDPVTGRRQVRMRVPYLGYAPIGAGSGLAGDSQDAVAEEADDPPPVRRSAGSSSQESGSLAPVDGWRGNGEASAHASREEADEDFPF